MKKVNHQELASLVERSYYTKVPLFIWGAPGIGKSEEVRRVALHLAKKEGLPFLEGKDELGKFGYIDMRISQFDPCDLRGLPTFKDDKMKWASPESLPRVGKGIIILDELNLAPPLVQSSAYQLILDRRLGNYIVPEGWAIIAAGNRAEDKAHVFDMARPLQNRFTHVELNVPSVEEWTTWATLNGVDSRITTFLNWKPSFLYKNDDKVKEQAFPTPRSWGKFASKMIEGVDNREEDTLNTLISCSVGEGVAAEFCAYIKLSKKIDIENLLEHPEQIKDIEEMSLKYTCLSALVEIAKKKPKEKLEAVVATTAYFEPEFAILLFRFLRYGIPSFVKLVQDKKSITEQLRKYGKYLTED